MARKLIIVNYHYIRDSEPIRGIYNVTPSFFKNQLNKIFNYGFQFISLEELHKYINKSDISSLNKDLCLITFDDGLKESYDIGFRILKEMGIPAAFYVSSATIETHRVIDVHKLHYILAKLSDEEIIQSFPRCFLDRLESVPTKTITQQYAWDSLNLARIKYLINFLMSAEDRNQIIGALFSYCCSNERQYAQELYMTKEQIKDLSNQNMLGSHGVSHSPLAGLTDLQLKHEMTESCSALNQITGNKIQSITYPYGGESAVSERVFKFAERSGYLSGMTMIRGVNYLSELSADSLMLKRFDTNDVFGGKSEFNFRKFL